MKSNSIEKKLSELDYKRPDLDEFNRHFDQYLEIFKAAQTAKEQIEALEKLNQLKKDFQSLMSLAKIRFSQNTEDPFYQAEKSFSTKPALSLSKKNAH